MVKYIKYPNPCTEYKKINCRYEIFHRCFSKSILMFHISSYCNMLLDNAQRGNNFNVKKKLSVTLNILRLFGMNKHNQHNVKRKWSFLYFHSDQIYILKNQKSGVIVLTTKKKYKDKNRKKSWFADRQSHNVFHFQSTNSVPFRCDSTCYIKLFFDFRLIWKCAIKFRF